MTAAGTAARREIALVNLRGLHARASAKFARLAGTFSARVTVEKDGLAVNGTSIMGLMLLAAACGETIVISAEGPDASEAVAALAGLIEDRFSEAD